LILHDNILYISFDECFQLGIAERTLKSWQAPVKVKLEGYANKWFNIGLLAPKYQTLIKAILCKGQEPGEWYAQSQIQNWLPALPAKDKEAMAKYVIQRAKPDLSTGELIDTTISGLPQATIQYYMLQARWMLLLRDGYSAHKQELVALGVQNKEAFVALCKLVAGKPLQYNDSNLRGKIAKYNREGITSLINGNWGDQKARKVTDEILQYLIDYYGSSLKPEIPMVTTWINNTAMANGWVGFPVVEGTVYNNLYKPDVMQAWYMSRHGLKAYKEKFGMNMSRFAPTQPNMLWVGDDTKVNLFYFDNGRKAKLNVYAIIDACSRCWLGWAFAANTEGKDVGVSIVKQAFKHAIDRTGGAQPYQMQYDNDKANAFYKELNTLHFPCMPYNGQSKIIERMFYKLQAQHMRFDKAFTGQNIQAKTLQSKINEDQVHVYPSMQDAINAQVDYFLQMNNTKDKTSGKTPRDIYATATEDFGKMSEYDYMELFWEWNTGNNKYDGNGISMQHLGTTYKYTVMAGDYPCQDFMANHSNGRFKIRYNPAKMDRVGLYTIKDNRFIAYADAKELMPMAVADYKEGTRARIDGHLAIKKQQVATAKARSAMAKEIANADHAINLGHKYVSKETLNLMEAEKYAETIEHVTVKTLDIEAERRARMRRAD
jgi:hypothetical protein